MNKTRSTLLLGALGLLVIAVVGWMFVLSPRFGHISDIKAQADQLQQQNASTQATISTIQQEKSTISSEIAYAADLSSRFPADSGEQDLFNEIRAAAAAAGISENNVTAVTSGAPTVVGTTGNVTLAPSSGSSTSPTTPTAPGASGQVATMTIMITAQAQPPALLRFLKNLEGIHRALLVNTSSIGYTSPVNSNTNATGSGPTLNVNGTLFLMPALTPPVTH